MRSCEASKREKKSEPVSAERPSGAPFNRRMDMDGYGWIRLVGFQGGKLTWKEQFNKPSRLLDFEVTIPPPNLHLK